jgi:ribosome maturation factor RimP
MSEILPELRLEAERIAESLGCELVDLLIKGPSQPRILEFFVDRRGGVTIEDCAAISRGLSLVIDERFQDFSDYRLEVSSPGLDRSLKTEKDFLRHLGSDLKVEWSLEGRHNRTSGTLKSVSSSAIEILEKDHERIIPISSVTLAKIKLKW